MWRVDYLQEACEIVLKRANLQLFLGSPVYDRCVPQSSPAKGRGEMSPV